MYRKFCFLKFFNRFLKEYNLCEELSLPDGFWCEEEPTDVVSSL